jgi:hypothetical protein
MVPGFELKVSCLLGRQLYHLSMSPAIISLVMSEVGSHIFVLVRLDHDSSIYTS